MKTVDVHQCDHADPDRRIDNRLARLARLAETIERNPIGAGGLCQSLTGAGAAAIARGRDRAVAVSLLRGAMEAGIAAFRMADADETAEVTVGGQRLTLPATGPTDYTHPLTWLDAFGLTLALRSPEDTTCLCSLDVELLRGSVTMVDDFRYEIVVAMQAFWLGRNWRRAVTEALELSQPEHTSVAGGEYVEVETSMLAMLPALEARDAAAFDEALAGSLEAHKRYWSAKRWSRSLRGLLAVTPLGLAALAHDRGMPVGVESGYIPDWIVQGELGG